MRSSLAVPRSAPLFTQRVPLIRAHPRFAGIGVLLLVILLWQVVLGALAPNHPALPTPAAILAIGSARLPALMRALLATGSEALLGFIVGSGLAVALGVLTLASRPVENNVYRLSLVMHSLPLIVIAPLLVIWLGGGMTPRVVIAALTCFFGVLISAIKGFKAVHVSSRELMYVLGADSWHLFWLVRLPSALPFLFAALKIAAVAAVLGAVVGEWIGADRGLGVIMLFALFEFQTAYLWAAMFVCTGLALASYGLIRLLERLAIPWHKAR